MSISFQVRHGIDPVVTAQRMRISGSTDDAGEYGPTGAGRTITPAAAELPAASPPTKVLAWCPWGCHEGFGSTGPQTGHSVGCYNNTFEVERRLNAADLERLPGTAGSDSRVFDESNAASRAYDRGVATSYQKWKYPLTCARDGWGYWDLRDQSNPKRVVLNSAALLCVV